MECADARTPLAYAGDGQLPALQGNMKLRVFHAGDFHRYHDMCFCLGYVCGWAPSVSMAARRQVGGMRREHADGADCDSGFLRWVGFLGQDCTGNARHFNAPANMPQHNFTIDVAGVGGWGTVLCV